MEWHHVAQTSEIEPGRPKILEINGKSIGVFFEGGRFFAVLNHCPHFGAPVCLGKVFGAVVADEPGVQSYDASRPILRCPWHRWEFDLETGRALTPIKQRLKTYNVVVRDNDESDEEETDGNVGVTTFGVRVEGEAVWVQV